MDLAFSKPYERFIAIEGISGRLDDEGEKAIRVLRIYGTQTNAKTRATPAQLTVDDVLALMIMQLIVTLVSRFMRKMQVGLASKHL